MKLSPLANWVVTIAPWKLFLASILFSIVIFFVVILIQNDLTFWQSAKIIEIFCYLVYNYVIGTSLFQRLPANASMNIRGFKSAVLLLVILAFVLFLFPFSPPSDLHHWTNFVLLLPAIIAAAYCGGYIAIFIVKAITSIEIGRTAKYEDYVDLIFFSMVFPFGVWVIQSRVKRIFERNDVERKPDF